MQNPIKSRKCFCCGSRYRLADHHLQPRESGGLNEERNLVTLCPTCHDVVEGQQEGLSAGDIWSNMLKRKASFDQESPRRRKYRLSRESSNPCPTWVSFEEKERYRKEKQMKVIINPRTGKGWTDEEEATFADIMRIGRVERIGAIQLFRRCKSDHAKAIKLAQVNYGRTEEQLAGMERSKAARLAGLAKARQRRPQDGSIRLLEAIA